jgi:uncharacterized protein (DUF58 family)
MRLTRRGYGAIVVVALAIGMAWLAGPRALNALAAPVLVALLAGAVQSYRAGKPTVERTEPRRGFPGASRTVELVVEGSGVARVEDALSSGLAGDATGEGTMPTTVTYEVTLEGRGEQTLGPTTVSVRDALGLLERRYEVDATTTVLVYPRVSVVDATAVFATNRDPHGEERTEFDRLREYVPGDRLRDVHWKASAKHDDLLVTNYTDPGHDDAVRIVAEATSGHADAMADAAASLAVGAIRAGIPVEVTVPDGTVGPGVGRTHRRRILELLARTGPGTVTDGADEGIHVFAGADGVTVTANDRTHDVADVTVRGENPLLAGEGTA